ncbi:nitrate- and nitrite sensing domain-containing protein [Thermobifida halotolerans]|uniref:histidine kinase n=1 Tax=Thermobifida halotolerans TaxID=483545 RepID=A0AA97LYY1_9ACTN|nr:nitrate- and nitrite sensing domain-containing protein [Thermobifida halotolerans]UOE20571.1 nitrate- and nitrite sensing domain-containing protein [Thermobifida halotolerans]
MTKEQRRPLHRVRLLSKEQRGTIRARLLALALIPSSALLIFWVGTIVTPVSTLFSLHQSTTFVEEAGVPALEVISALQAERHSTMEYLALSEAESGENILTPELRQDRLATDTAVADFRAGIEEAGLSGFPGETRDRIDRFLTTLEVLSPHRDVLDSSTPVRSGAASTYDEAIEAGLQLWDIQEKLVDGGLTHEVRNLTSLVRARELLSQEDGLLTYASASGTFTAADHIDFAAAVGAQRYLYTQIAPELSGTDRSAYDAVMGSSHFRTVQTLENETVRIGATAEGIPIDIQSWESARETLDQSFQKLEEDRAAALVEQSQASALRLTLLLALLSLVTLAVTVASVVFSSRTVTWLNRRLGALREATLDYAHSRLPSITSRLRSGEEVDVATDAPPIPVEINDEIGQVTEAFNTAQRAAVDSATQEAKLREGVRNVFRNIARRAQTLVHRQLSLLDSLEQSETDPKVLESLFRIDHLSTQMRRNAENLMLLTDDRPSRKAGEPLSLAQAARAASSEIEDYSRVKLLPMPNVRIRGQVAGDTVRLLAELLENATSFSPPNTTVTVRGEALPHGSYALEVEDRGLGMLPQGYADANELLSGSVQRFNLADMREDSQLGLIVVATIAQRHGLKVTLRPSPYNGTQAIIVFPPEAVDTEAASPPAVEPARSAPAELEAPAAAATEPAPTAPVPTAPAESTAPPSPGASADPDTYKGLPRRRRSHRRSQPTPPAPAPSISRPVSTDRSLEEIRQMMNAFQRGTRTGRAEGNTDQPNRETR